MKKVIFCFLLIACSSTNDRMNSLLSEKKQTENRIDSLNTVSKIENDLSYDKDTVKSNEHMKSSFKAELSAREEKQKLEQIKYSIDSLSKLK